MELRGRAFKFGDNIDTDLIISAKYLVTTDPGILREHCMEDISEFFIKEVEKGDFILGGSNFGCGSSREQAVLAISGCGVKVILAQSFARIFYRNAINRGIYLLEINEDTYNKIQNKDFLTINLNTGEITIGTGEILYSAPISSEIQGIVEAGGIIPYTKSKVHK